jgi:ADP-heptose:LPS heptosyltransferase
VSLVSLQVGRGTEQLASAPFSLTDLGNRFDQNSLEDLAGTLMNLDLVVTVDTAVAHLAGALGVPVWVALPFVPDWRWLLDRDDSPWYPTLRLFRQSSVGDWRELFERIAQALVRLLTEPKMIENDRSF